MKFKNKTLSLVFALLMIVGSSFVIGMNDSYAKTNCIKKLSAGKTYYYNLDGDKDKDSIKQYVSRGSVYLKINGVVKKVISDYYPEYMSYNVKIYDFNKKDKSLDIVITHSEEDCYYETRIIKFKNKTCKLNKVYKDSYVYSYDNSNGMIKFKARMGSRYSYFMKSIGCFVCSPQTRINGYNVYDQYTANMASDSWMSTDITKHNYIAAKKLTAYTSTNGKKKAYTINKGEVVHVYAFYQNGNKRYIKVKNKYGKYAYVKASSSLLFTSESCLWWG